VKAPTVCLLCGGGSFRRIHARGPYGYFGCRRCGLVALSPTPSQRRMQKGYREDYLSSDPRAIRRWRRMTAPVVDASVRLIQTRWQGPAGRLLDVGSGYGFFLKAMQDRGWRAEGIELSRSGRAYSRTLSGARVASRPLETLDLPPDTFDVVTLFYVIEHLPRPDRFLALIRPLLKPGGLLVLRWPHTTPIVRLLGPLAGRLDLYHTPYHLFDFSPATIERLLAGSGFGSIETVTGGYTLPGGAGSLCSMVCGTAGRGLQLFSGGRLLLPGVSKTTVAVNTAA
jgi:SAM-dependent methyltransferase